MKRKVYVVLFTLLGLQFGFFAHMLLEVWWIKLLLADYGKYGFGLTWKDWEMVHMYGVPFLMILFGALGYLEGVKFWKILYVDQKYSKVFGMKLKKDF